MRNIIAVFTKELQSYFYTYMLYASWALFMFVNGWVFIQIVSVLNNQMSSVQVPPVEIFFGGTIFFWLIMLLIVPIITMRLVSSERSMGTFEAIFTTRVAEYEFVLGKFFAAMFVFTLFWASTIVYLLLLKGRLVIDWQAAGVAFLGTIIMGGAMIAIGVFASSLTQNQVIAALLTFVITIVLFSIGLFGYWSIGIMKDIFSYFSMLDQFGKFSKGILDTRAIVYFLSLNLLFLYLSAKTIESRRWKE